MTTPRLLLAALAATLLVAAPAAAQSNPDTIGVERIEAFMLGAAQPCATAPAEVCIEEVWRFADRDRDGHLAADELAAVKNELGAWAEWKKPLLGQRDRAGLAVGEMVVRSLQPGQLIEGFDNDGNQLLSQAELTQDIDLDGRPLPDILQDKAAVDWQAVQGRLGAAAPLIALLAQAQAAR